MHRFHLMLVPLLGCLDAVWAASPRDRMGGVASFAQGQQSAGPDMVALGILAVFGLVALAVFGAAMREETGKVKVRRRR